jgi:hypothetical protein
MRGAFPRRIYTFVMYRSASSQLLLAKRQQHDQLQKVVVSHLAIGSTQEVIICSFLCVYTGFP